MQIWVYYWAEYIQLQVLSTVPVNKDGDLLACDCKDQFSKFVINHMTMFILVI